MGLSTLFFTQTSSVDYDCLCRLDVLGLADSSVGDQQEVYVEFKEQLHRDPAGWYETGVHGEETNHRLRTMKPDVFVD